MWCLMAVYSMLSKWSFNINLCFIAKYHRGGIFIVSISCIDLKKWRKLNAIKQNTRSPQRSLPPKTSEEQRAKESMETVSQVRSNP